MQSQLHRLGLPYEFFDAVHGAQTPDHYLFRKYNDKKRASLRGAGASLRLPQLGCFASHYLLWEECVRAGRPIMVLEDDAILLPGFMDFYRHAADFTGFHGLIWMQPSRKAPNQAGRPLRKIGPFTVKKFAKGFSGCTGYLITPAAARNLLDYAQEWLYPVDITMDRFYDHKVEAIGIDPVCVMQDDDLESSINVADTGRRRGLGERLRREYANLKDGLRRVAHNLVFAAKLKLGRQD